MKPIVSFAAFDGKQFPSRKECEAYEAERSEALVLGLRADKLAEMLAGNDPARAEAFERLGRKLAALRIERGGSKRTRKAQAASETAQEPAAGAPAGGQEQAA